MLLSRKDAIRKKYAKFYSDDAGPPGSNPLSSELAELEAIANNAGVKILDMRTQITDEESLNKEFSVDLKLEGPVEGYVKFIYNVENSLLNLKIKTFALTIKSQDRNLEGSFSIAKFAATDR